MALRNKKREQDKLSSARSAPQVKAQAANERERPASPALALERAASAPPSALTPSDVLALQRAVGNRAVVRILGNRPNPATPRTSTGASAVQRKAGEDETPSRKIAAEARNENRTGLPDDLKAGIENLSGVAMDDVRVHYNSPTPAVVQALAYTQGTDIHVGPGHEEHLPHEAWHVAQQKQGRVKPTLQVKGLPINDEAGLEREADVMGDRAIHIHPLTPQPKHGVSSAVPAPRLIQMKWAQNKDKTYQNDETYETYDPSTKKYRGEEFKAEWGEKVLTVDQANELMKQIEADTASSVEPPKEYVKIQEGQRAIYAAGLDLVDNNLLSVAKTNLIEGAFDLKSGSWHRSNVITGATANDYYLHPSKKSNKLYLLKDEKTHTDGLRKIKIVKEGSVKDGVHKF